jgi:hypothetical protein
MYLIADVYNEGMLLSHPVTFDELRERFLKFTPQERKSFGQVFASPSCQTSFYSKYLIGDEKLNSDASQEQEFVRKRREKCVESFIKVELGLDLFHELRSAPSELFSRSVTAVIAYHAARVELFLNAGLDPSPHLEIIENAMKCRFQSDPMGVHPWLETWKPKCQEHSQPHP